MILISFAASSIIFWSVPQMDTLPSSVMSIFTPVLLDDRVDGLSSLANHIADLLRIDLHLDDLRSVWSYFRSRLADSSGTCTSSRMYSLALLLFCDRLLDDRSGQAVDLDIHLDCGDTIVGTGHLEVHIAEEIFQALDIGQYDIIIIGLTSHQTAGNTCNRAS